MRDELVWLGADRADRAAHPSRIVTIQTDQGPRRYLTNVVCRATLSVAEIDQLYRRRWAIERAFKTVKRELGLSLI